MLSNFRKLFKPNSNERSSRLKSNNGKSRQKRLAIAAATSHGDEAGGNGSGESASKKADGSSMLSRMFSMRFKGRNKTKSADDDKGSVPPTTFSGATTERSYVDSLDRSALSDNPQPDISLVGSQEPRLMDSRVEDNRRVEFEDYNERQLHLISEESENVQQQQQQQQQQLEDNLSTLKSSFSSRRTSKYGTPTSTVKTDVDQLLTGAASQQHLRDTVRGNLEDLRLAESVNYRYVLYEYSFRIEHNPSNMRIFTDPADRRIEAIARSCETKIQLEQCRSGERARTRLVTIQASDLHSLEKCCRLFDDRFPHFYASGGLGGQNTRAIRRIYVDDDKMDGQFLDPTGFFASNSAWKYIKSD